MKNFFERSDSEYLKLCRLYFEYSRQHKGNVSFELVNRQSCSSVKWSKEEDELVFSFYRKFKTEPEEYCFGGKESIGIALEAKWFELEVVEMYGSVADLPFPAVDPEAETHEIERLAQSYEIMVRQLLSGERAGLQAVHIMGELTFSFALVARLRKVGIACIASTTRRHTADHADGSKTTSFGFVRFREYAQL